MTINMKSGLLAAIFIFLLTAGNGTVGQAQSFIDFSINLSPEIPASYENVTASLVSYSLDLDRSPITWVLNGKTVLSGVGKKTYSFTMGAPGSSSRLSVSVSSAAGILNKSLTITPGDIDLLWEVVDGYAPPFYRGKILPAPESNIKVVALPSVTSGGQTVKASNLVYQWSRNFKAIAPASGYGKNVYTFKNSYLDQSENVSVSASTAAGDSGAYGKISINLVEPFVLFYENDPLRGIRYETALGGFGSSQNEVRLSAEPYFFSAANYKQGPSMSYSWKINGDSVSSAPDDSSSIVLRSAEPGAKAVISVIVSHVNKILQQSAAEISVNLGN